MGTSLPHNEKEITDGELISRINSGEYELFHILITRYRPFIKSTASSLAQSNSEIEDLMQEGMLALYFAVGAFKAKRAGFRSFAFTCIKNAMIDVLRKQSSKHKIPESMFSSLSDVEPQDDNTPEKIFFDNENYRILTDSINLELSKLEHKVLTAHLSGFSYADIASALGISVKSVDNSLKRVRAKLKGLK